MERRYIKKIARLRKITLFRWTWDYFKTLYDKTVETNSQVRMQALQFLPFLVASFFTGLVAFLYSRIFRLAEKVSIELYNKEHWIIFILTPVTFLISWWIVRRFAPSAVGSGIPQVMTSIEIANPKSKKAVNKILEWRVIPIKAMSSLMKVLGGGVLGREGPTIQISATIFNIIYSILPSWWIPVVQKNILIAGAASGLSAAFNTPLGGIIFAIEELSKYHIRHYKSILFIAVIIAGLTAQGFGGSYLYLGYPKVAFSDPMVYLAIPIVAILTGYFGSKMAQYIYRILRYFREKKKAKEQLLIIFFCSLVVSVPIYFLGQDAMGSGKELMENLLFTDQKTVPWYIIFIRMNSLMASFSFGGAGGIFAPSLSSGATFGSLVAEYMNITGAGANLIILIGMVGFLTAVTKAPFTASIIIFEMTDRHSIIFFLLLGAIIASVVASYVDKVSLYDKINDDYLKEYYGNQIKKVYDPNPADDAG